MNGKTGLLRFFKSVLSKEGAQFIPSPHSNKKSKENPDPIKVTKRTNRFDFFWFMHSNSKIFTKFPFAFSQSIHHFTEN
jgi:hypothetical protein